MYNSDYFSNDASADYQPVTKMGFGNTAMKLGQGWTLDIIRTMKTETIEGTEYLCYQDGDGTKHYFAIDEEKNNTDDSSDIFYYDEDGLGLKAKIYNTAKTSFMMYDDKGSCWVFSSGRMFEYSDETGNKYRINYGSDNKISTIVQTNKAKSSITVATFAYSGDYVSSITDAAGNVYGFSYTDGKLTGINRNGTVIAAYEYSGNRLIKMTDKESSYSISFSYSYGRVARYQEYAGTTAGAAVTITYPNYSKTVYRSPGTDHIQGNTDDLLTYYLFDYAGRTINVYTTDLENNILGATNAAYTGTGTTPVYNNAGVKTGDRVDKKNNRTLSNASIGSVNPTLLHNGGFEIVNNYTWIHHVNTSETMTAGWDTSNPRTGKNSLKLTSSTGEKANFSTRSSLNLTAGEKYTVSAYVNTKACTSITGNGIYLSVTDTQNHLFKGNGLDYITSESMDGGWVRIHLTFTALSGGIHTVGICNDGAVGTFYVDDVQLEQSETPGSLNLLQNGSLETSGFGWTGAIYAAGYGWNQSNAVLMMSAPDRITNMYQEVPINLPGTQTYVVSAWTKAYAVPDNLDTRATHEIDLVKQYGLRVVVTYTDNGEEYHYIACSPDVSEWQYTAITIVPKAPQKTVKSIRVICAYEGNANGAVFDNVCLSRESAQTMKYNEDGELVSVTTPGLKEDENTYSGGNLIKTVTGGNGIYTYTYDETYKHRLTSVTDGIVTQTLGHDFNGNVNSTTLKSNMEGSTAHITTSATYTNGANLLASVTDANGNTVSYVYSDARNRMFGLPSSFTDGRGNSTVLQYDEAGRTISTAVAETAEVEYNYVKGNLSTILRTDNRGKQQTYGFVYDAFGRLNRFHVGDMNLATYSYGANNGNLTKQTYGNGDYVTYTYDLLGRVIKETYSDGRTVDYVYSSEGQIYSSTDSVSGTTYYTYDSLGRLLYSSQEETGVHSKYSYDSNNRLTHAYYNVEDWDSFLEEYQYNGETEAEKADEISDGTLTGMQMVTGRSITRELDELQRLTDRTTANMFWEQYTYCAGSGSDATTTQVYQKKNMLCGATKSQFYYEYDGNGNIIRVFDSYSCKDTLYTYDSQNQLTGTVHSDGRTESYTYDSAGNLLTFHNGISSHTYTYGNSSWKDLLTAVDGVALSYDGAGNPTGYYNGTSYTMNWTEGRKLSSLTMGNATTTYQYNAEGLRIRKTGSDGSYILYMTADGSIIGEKHYDADGTITKHLRYTFDENGTVCGYSVSTDGSTWTDYYFIRSLQGDVLQVFNGSSAAIVATYTYDAWGNILSAEGEQAEVNPFRYRGYYYDSETGFYATGTRYYDPEIGRFINADDISYLGADGTPISYNLFAYCLNNPVNRFDDNGNWSMPNSVKLIIGTVALAGAIALTVATGGGAAVVAVGVAKIVASVAVSTAVSAGVGYLQNGKQGAIDGACNGFMFGSLSACGGAALKFAKVHAATTGSPNSIGKAGEKMAGIDPSAKQPITINGRTRIPDALTDTVLTEVKNVKYISNTLQLKDYAQFANSTGRTLELYVRPTTKVAKTVLEAGWNINYLW